MAYSGFNGLYEIRIDDMSSSVWVLDKIRNVDGSDSYVVQHKADNGIDVISPGELLRAEKK
jgi:hypothetical protein